MREMAELAEKSGKTLMFNLNNRARLDALHIKKLIVEGKIGRINSAQATWQRRTGIPCFGGWFTTKAIAGGGPLIDIGTHALDVTLWIMNNYKPKYCVGTTYHKLNNDTETGNAWGDWDPAKFTVEDCAFGFVVMENGATINLESAWALNTLDVKEAVTSVCGTKAGGDLWDGVRINGIRQGRQYVLKPNLNAGGVAFYDGDGGDDPATREARQWINAVINDKNPCVLPEQAFCVTQILEGIYESAKTGDIYRFTK